MASFPDDERLGAAAGWRVTHGWWSKPAILSLAGFLVAIAGQWKGGGAATVTSQVFIFVAVSSAIMLNLSARRRRAQQHDGPTVNHEADAHGVTWRLLLGMSLGVTSMLVCSLGTIGAVMGAQQRQPLVASAGLCLVATGAAALFACLAFCHAARQRIEARR